MQVRIDNLYETHAAKRLVKGLVVKLLDTCKHIGEMKQSGANVALSIATVLTPKNLDDLSDLRQFLEDNIPYDDLVLIYPRGNVKDPMFKEVALDEYREGKKMFEATRGKAGSFARLYQVVYDRASGGNGQ